MANKLVDGSNRILYIKYGENFLPIGCLTDNSFSEEVSLISTTTRDNINGWESSLPTSQRYGIAFSGYELADFLIDDKTTYQVLRLIKRRPYCSRIL